MSLNFEELDHAETPYGELILRRRRALSLDGAEFYEVKLGGDFLMSSLVNQSEIALSELGLDVLGDPGPWDVVVGGLGLGYTAATALDRPALRSLLVVESLAEVIAWHERGLVPLGERLTGDERCRFVHADFFACARDAEGGFDPQQPGRRFDAILLDIDHSPDGLLHSDHADFYRPAGLARLATHLRPGGVFALWSSEPPDEAFGAQLGQTFDSAETHSIRFFNPLLDRDDVNCVYVCRTAASTAETGETGESGESGESPGLE
jgi:hypothetical protein